ncbi:MAG: type I-E CRISPR-associated protein Cse2/CasB [Bacteroidota bacterium]|nr:type I-E CRISPR-associated protein Cse2/CasB [Candidatus Kapabacteria bacterium]MDW8220795.1 type I-E CRISPR-associated protein Cse2/CasB [Bacteroidota bacterium]
MADYPFYVKPIFAECSIFRAWLQRLHNPDENYTEGGKSWKPELRRAPSLDKVLHTEPFVALYEDMKPVLPSTSTEFLPEYISRRLALIAGVVVHGKYHEEHHEPIGSTFKGTDNNRKALSEQRFRRLMSLDDENALDKIFLEWKRVTTMFKDDLSLPQLADTLYYWTDRYNGDKVRANLAYFYYHTSRNKTYRQQP